MSKKKKRKKQKNPIDWIEVAVQFLTGLITGVILLLIEKLLG